MRIKSLISNLLNLSKSASFVLMAMFYFTNCNQMIARQDNSTAVFLFDGPPITNSGSGTGK